MESVSTGTRLMQTNAKFTTGKLSTARWLRETPFESGAESASESELELESKSKSKAEREQPLLRWFVATAPSGVLCCCSCYTTVILLLYGMLDKCKFDLRRLECVSCGGSLCLSVVFGFQVFNCRKEVPIGWIKSHTERQLMTIERVHNAESQRTLLNKVAHSALGFHQFNVQFHAIIVSQLLR